MIKSQREGLAMAEAAAAHDAPDPPLHTLADKVNWLIDRAHPAARGPYSNAELAELVEKITGEQFSHTTIWKLRNGQATNPQMRLLQALANTFGVPPAFFFDDYDPAQTGLLAEQVELLALIRDSGITATDVRTLAELSPAARRAIADLITHTAHTEQQNRSAGA